MTLVPRVVELLHERKPATTLEALKLLTYELSTAVNAAAWSISSHHGRFRRGPHRSRVD